MKQDNTTNKFFIYFALRLLSFRKLSLFGDGSSLFYAKGNCVPLKLAENVRFLVLHCCPSPVLKVVLFSIVHGRLKQNVNSR